MTSSQSPLHGLVLTPQQQSLLFAALNSNRPTNGLPSNTFNNMQLFDGSPVQADGMPSFQTSPDLDYDYDFPGPDPTLDFSFDDGNQPKLIGDLPGPKRTLTSESGDAESSEKRSHPDDGENPGAKRRESEEKVAKKPGRKPLTTEPSSKRKAQNRAAQRAFRERKEKHLKDLENKVQELEKLSEAANHENEALRAQVEKLTHELNEYKKRLSALTGNRALPQGVAQHFGNLFLNNLNDVNFQFEFPKFGNLPGAPTDNAKKPSATSPERPKQSSADHRSPSANSQDGVSPGNSSTYSQVGLDAQTKQDLADASSALYHSPASSDKRTAGSSASTDTHYNLGGATATSSPSASSSSNGGGPSSSCGTSPEPSTQSPTASKPVDAPGTIEERPSLNGQSQDLGHFVNTGADDFSNWLPQSDFQFDPQQFGGYRDSQDLLTFDDSFFNEAVEIDFFTPYNMPISSPALPKKDLIAQIDAAKESDEPPAKTGPQLLKCSEVWEKIQNCTMIQGSDFDLDGLCADLQKKAKCDGSGPVVSQEDFQDALNKFLGKDKEEVSKRLQQHVRVEKKP
ncbi:hypothetical protein VTH06DRAFT_7799 [Thermothelomyces fergusii]